MKRKNQEKNEKNGGTVIFILDTEASDFGIGGVLSQKGNDGEELLAVVVFTQHLRPYLLS